MVGNQYHLLSFIPATRAWEMPAGLETLAQQLLQSGKLRINADTERNFVRLGTADADKTFTARELTATHLRAATWDQLARHIPPSAGNDGVNELHQRLLADLKKARGIPLEKETYVARVLVQSAHPAVIGLLLQSGAEIYVSYAHNVADLMAMHRWDSSESTASGLQATQADGAAVYVSCGGDPFFSGEHKTYTTDGFPALARMVVIAGQELGHFADLRRSKQGIVGRYSTDPNAMQLRAHPMMREGRIDDLKRVAQLQFAFARAGLKLLRKAEKGVAFYHARFRFTPPWLLYQAFRFFAWGLFVARCRMAGMHHAFKTYPYHRHGEAVELWLEDMAFNLAPDADVYRHADPLVEEAIACIEALARVPQQVHKWGHAGVQTSWPQLYRYYFGTVIPAAEAVTGLSRNTNKISLLQQLMVAVRRAASARPDYYPEPLRKPQKNA